ncbi:MAG: glycosyltransferase [Nanoarchaeota archaeon]
MVFEDGTSEKSDLQQILDLSDPDIVKRLRSLSPSLEGKRVIMINSTAQGGGVAEILHSFVSLFQELGMETIWKVLEAPPHFFEVTKRFHNALQGDGDANLDEQMSYYESFYRSSIKEKNPELFELLDDLDENDIVVVHDPQPLALATYRKDDGSRWVWRCHIDVSEPHEKLWEFVESYAKQYDRIIVSKDSFIKGDDKDYVIIPPSINPISEKNRDMTGQEVENVLKRFDVPLDKGLITQVSRLDKWKDPIGVIRSYNAFREIYDDDSHRLALVYNTAIDDPEGQAMEQRVKQEVEKSPFKKDIIMVLGEHPLLVNALQRYSTIVFQKSLREGFGLTVSEALWKRTPVIATKAGGIPLQIRDGVNGFLLETYPIDEEGNAKDKDDEINHIRQAARKIHEMLSAPGRIREMGSQAHDIVKKHFLTSRHILDYMELFINLDN